ncbi:hypothetical protein KDW_59860 [Dictyobacter vulcani]|uniref:N-acetyltransferase domain-containing protein n=1 Tax=Dictyobacter vulcani TaxID=2607529 RepID=A0A5J4KR19_9CHLR|nr:hypothetical protein [Dictyobacter vulcani]GER91824.1 hypothetical protein KDW_59860 [Dictyobacter vulcani]
MYENYLQLAVFNNAVWCDTVCQSHAAPGEFQETYWLHPRQTPTYYPNLVTLAPADRLDLQQPALATFLKEKQPHTISVKDSFADLDLAPFGFQQLFEAQWIFRPATTGAAHVQKAGIQWKKIESEAELLAWESAWAHTDLEQNDTFRRALLANTDICIVAAYKEDQIMAGAIGNRTTGVIGLSNIFTPEQDTQMYWAGILDLLTSYYPAMPIVGYEQNESLEQALQAGFTTLGPLRVWLKAE